MSETQRYVPNLDNQDVDDLVKNIIGEIPTVEYVEVKLPSLGTAIYGLETPFVHIRPMTFADEKVIISSKKNSGMNILLSRCIEEDIDPKSLLVADKLAILFNLRALSVGNEYEFQIPCKNCETKSKTSVDVLKTFPCKYSEQPIEKTIRTKLPETQKEVVIRRASSFEVEEDQLRVINELWRYMLEIEGITNAKVRSQVIDYLPRKDIHFMVEQITLPNLGIDQKFLFHCSKCGHEELEELKLSSDFFTMK